MACISPMSRKPWRVTSTVLTSSGGSLGKLTFMTTPSPHFCSSKRAMMPGPNASAVSQCAIASSWKRSSDCDRAIERMPKAMPCRAPATVPE
ncbi:hypothetical protein D3C80_2048370 [compost metagenome]